jgi:non-haem Fe2+, alpha-ketoglutarate-dependent halogenase
MSKTLSSHRAAAPGPAPERADADTISTMMQGCRTLDEQLAAERMRPSERRKYLGMVAVAVALRCTYGVVRPHVRGGFDITRDLDAFTGHQLRAKGTKRHEVDGGHHLRADEVATYEQKGLLGPFPLLSPDDARRMKERAIALHERDWDGRIMLGDDVANALKRHGAWGLDYSGMYQALRYPEWWDLLCRPEITHRVSSLIGDDVLCWRSQFFEKRPGTIGTFWHQASAFRESSEAEKLVAVDAPGDLSNHGMLQVSMWLALDDATVDNGTMRFLPGSFSDSRLEEIGNRILDHPVEVMASLGVRDIAKAIRVLGFTANDFIKAQLLFEYGTALLPDVYAGLEVVEMEVPAGQFILFTEVNMHGSWPNVTADSHRLAFGGRYTTNDVAVYPGFDYDVFPTPEGMIKHPVDHLGCIQVMGEDRFGRNNIQAAPTGA